MEERDKKYYRETTPDIKQPLDLLGNKPDDKDKEPIMNP